MERLLQSLIVTLTGLVIVFFGLVVLIGLIKILSIATNGMGKKKETKKAPEAAVAVAPAPAEDVPATADDDALIAVITAAVACMMEDGSGFTVRRIRRINNAPAWNRAGREEQIYSRF